jgi:hypothetical protein
MAITPARRNISYYVGGTERISGAGGDILVSVESAKNGALQVDDFEDESLTEGRRQQEREAL